MDEALVKKELRRKLGQNSWIVLIYYFILNAAVTASVFIYMIFLLIQSLLDPSLKGFDFDALLEERMLNNAWGYLAACLIGGLILLLWKKPDFCFHKIWKSERKMSLTAFFTLFCVFFSAQALFTLLTPLIEWLLNQVGLSAVTSLENASGAANSVSMFLYASLFAPVFEEILFRGLILRNMMPYGKKIAILGSAFLFGIFHGNLLQSPYAFACGLVLGYTAAEYSLGWAVLLHFLNNFVLGDLMTRLSEMIPGGIVEFGILAFIFGCAAVSLILAAVKSKKIAAYFAYRRIHPWCLSAFFKAPGTIVITVMMVFNMILLLLI